MEYYLMRKDDLVTLCDISRDGQMISYAAKMRNPELSPLEYRVFPDHLKRWWQNRHVPLHQGRIEVMLREKGLFEPGEYLLKNLGLSLTDHYWVKPVGSHLRWQQVNLFENDFKENALSSISDGWSKSPAVYTPNSSLKGELEKSWIIRKGKRILLKGNHGSSSFESLNEVFASEFHKEQGYDNYTPYRLIRIKDKDYNFGCCSEAFTSNDIELVSANALITSEKRPEGVSVYEHLIAIAENHGVDPVRLRKDLEYQILSDFVLSNTDRHMDNIGFLREAGTLKLIRMAPIFDTGRAFGGGGIVPYTDYEISEMPVNSFEHNERGLLKLVQDWSLIDTNRLPSAERIEALYQKDDKMPKSKIQSIVRLYEIKKQAIEEWQASEQENSM